MNGLQTGSGLQSHNRQIIQKGKKNVSIMRAKYCELLTVVVAASFFRVGHSVSSVCIDTGARVDGSTVYTPKHCGPTTCNVTSSGGTAVDKINCIIGNFGDSYPSGCADIKRSLVSPGPERYDSRPQLDDVCQPKLASIGLYNFSCKELALDEVSLSFTFHLPVCGRGSSAPLDAVMVEFNAKNESIHNYYAIHPVCRVFYYGSTDFSRFSSDESIRVSYDCMGIGLQDKYPKVYYYLSLTSYPYRAMLNYTLVYMDGAQGTVQLIAAAWVSTRRVHVVFLPQEGVSAYLVQARGRQFSSSHTVSSTSPSVEIEDISPQASIVTVTLVPMAWEEGRCSSIPTSCSPVKVTLHDRTQLIDLPVEPEKQGEAGQLWVPVVNGIAGAIVALAALLTVAALTRKCFRATKGSAAAMEEGRRNKETRALVDHTGEEGEEEQSVVVVVEGERSGSCLGQGAEPEEQCSERNTSPEPPDHDQHPGEVNLSRRDPSQTLAKRPYCGVGSEDGEVSCPDSGAAAEGGQNDRFGNAVADGQSRPCSAIPRCTEETLVKRHAPVATQCDSSGFAEDGIEPSSSPNLGSHLSPHYRHQERLGYEISSWPEQSTLVPGRDPAPLS